MNRNLAWNDRERRGERGNEKQTKGKSNPSLVGYFLPKVKCIKCPKKLIDKNILSLTEDKAVLLGLKLVNAVEMLQFALLIQAYSCKSTCTI